MPKKKQRKSIGLIVFLVLDIAILTSVALYFFVFKEQKPALAIQTQEKVLQESSGVKSAKAILLGKTYSSQGLTFTFNENGKFSGFFDSIRTNVKDYIYELTGSEGKETYLTILNPDRNEYIQYIVSTKDSNIILRHPKTCAELELSSVN